MFLDILSIKNVFEIHPLSLESEPFINDIANVAQLLFPFFDLSTNFSHMLGPHHCLDAHLVVFELGNCVFNFSNDKPILSVSVLDNCEVGFLPDGDDLIKSGFDRSFATRLGGNVFDLVKMLVDVLV